MTELVQNLIDALALGSLYALIALGVTVVYTVMDMMNFAHGEFIMLSAYALFVLAGVPFGVAVGGALLTGVLIAVLAERVAFRPVRRADLSAQLVTSLAVATIVQNAVVAIVNARPKSVATPSFVGETTQIGSLSVPNLEFVTLALTAFGQGNAPTSAVAPQDPNRIIQFLSSTISWYRQRAAEDKLVNEPADLTFSQENARVADQVADVERRAATSARGGRRQALALAPVAGDALEGFHH